MNLSTLNDYVNCFIYSLFCGVCVHLSVKSFNFLKLQYEKVIIIILFVFIFVFSGFHHCIANTFYVMLDKGLKLTKNNYISLSLMIVGNWLGTLPLSVLTKHLLFIKNSETDSLTEDEDSSLTVSNNNHDHDV